MKKLLLITTLIAAAITGASAQTVYKTIDSSELVNGYMNVFELPANGGGYAFGSGWGIADLKANFLTATNVTFSPNNIGDPNSYWYTPSGAPGSTGNKMMQANLYGQDDTLTGKTIQFDGTVSAFNLSSTYQGVGYNFRAFVKDFAPDYSSSVDAYSDLGSTGNFQVSLATISDSARHVQWGLQMFGPDIWPTDNAAQIAEAGSVTVEAIPEPSTYALLGMTAAALFAYRARRRK